MLDKVTEVLERRGVKCERVHAVDADIQFGVETEMGKGDKWPAIHKKIVGADILVIGTPIWLGQRCSVCQMVLERMDAMLSETNEEGQLPLYNKVAGVCVVGNEDGADLHEVVQNGRANMLSAILVSHECRSVLGRPRGRRGRLRRRSKRRSIREATRLLSWKQPCSGGSHAEK